MATADWTRLLENDAIDIEGNNGDFRGTVSLKKEAPPGFGRSEYQAMIEDLWSEGEYQKISSLDKGLDLLEQCAILLGDSVKRAAETTFSREFDREEYGWAAFGAAFASGGMVLTPYIMGIEKGGETLQNHLISPGHTYADTIYNMEEEVEEAEARVFYHESNDGRYVTVGPARPGKYFDPVIAENVFDYMEHS